MQSSARLAPSRRASVVLLLVGAAAACGGAEASDLFNGTSTSGTDGGADPDSASADSAAADSGAGTDSGGGNDTGTPQEDTGAPDTGRPKDDPGISCGQGASGEINCNPTTQYCCGSASGGSGVNFECRNAVATCGGVKIMCDDTADCPGVSPYCCGTFVQNTGYTKIACSTNAACGTPSGNTSYVRFCDPGAKPDECAANGETCSGQSGSLPGYTYCK
jgi:hypothetical protein